MKAEIEAPRTLNAHGVSEALRNKLSKTVVPELARIHRVVAERKAALVVERGALATPKIDASDAVANSLRWEARTYLRGLDPSARMLLLMQNPPDPIFLAAALQGPPELSGLTAQMRADVEQAYVKA